MTLAQSKKVRVRIAPSPTGFFHIGTARTALFNWLYARHTGGSFILRIEDTDRERSTKAFEEDILAGMAWLGLDYDEGPLPGGGEKGDFGPYHQTARLDSYEKYLHLLLDEHKAYYCFCSKEELEGERQSQESAGLAPKYSGKCRSLSPDEVLKKQNSGSASVIRLKVPAERIRFHDQIRGAVEFDNTLSGDIVIAKNLREPLYNFAVVVDDYEMQITHVIRGEDHVANTPKQIAIAQALGFPALEYAHLPLILNPDRSKMSKRFNATAMNEYRAKGYLPEAMINFLALLGWHASPDQTLKNGEKNGDREVLSQEELFELFDISRIQKGGAIFNQEKLAFFNQQYLKKLELETIAELLRAGGFIGSAWQDDKLLVSAIGLVRERMVVLSDFAGLADFVVAPISYDPKILVWKKGSIEGAGENLNRIHEALSAVPTELFTLHKLTEVIDPIAQQFGKGDVFWPLRVALSGKEQSPPPVEILTVLGKSESLRRIEYARQILTRI